MQLISIWILVAFAAAYTVKKVLNIKLNRKSLSFTLLALIVSTALGMGGLSLYVMLSGISQQTVISLYLGIPMFLAVFSGLMYYSTPVDSEA